MKRKSVYVGDYPIKVSKEHVRGEFVNLDGERYYKISDYDQMPDFFLSIVSASDHWLFISSNGSLSAGRKNAESALFPYYTEDKIHDFHGKTGSKTLILANRAGKWKLWEPFSKNSSHLYPIRRDIYKNQFGNKLIFEEINEELSLHFRYGWYNSEKYGFIRNSTLINTGSDPVELDVLDGLLNILPGGVDSGMQTGFSSLMDAYKRSELVREAGLGIFRLSSIPVDTAEPSESLKVNTVWSEGLDHPNILLSSKQIDCFRAGEPVETEQEIKAEKGAYLVNMQFDLNPTSEKSWSLVAEVNQDGAEVTSLLKMLHQGNDLRKLLEEDIDQSLEELMRIVASSDALQSTHDELSTSRHLTNVLFNVMRGGLFEEQYTIQSSDFVAFVENSNSHLTEEARILLKNSGEYIQYLDLLNRVKARGHHDLIRICYEYLPLSFSRRHGDPSRPWNKFSIESRKEDGSRNLDYEGNWRDIFQNWEALSLSFPEYIEGMICKFVNASTVDGYNPYRITRGGIDWEVPDPADPWSNIGYWGDHQIIYLLKLLEISHHFHPGKLKELLAEEIFSFANIPYRIKPYGDLLKDPHDTIDFDQELDQEITNRVKNAGSDGKLVWDPEGKTVHVNLAEKLLVTLLSKLSNFIPGAGIWMNTQRPEWNDANNALVGYGVSMVTTYYLRAFLNFCFELFRDIEKESYVISEEVVSFLTHTIQVFQELRLDEKSEWSGLDRKKCMEALGQLGSDFRSCFYENGFSGKKESVKRETLLDLFHIAMDAMDRTIAANKRADSLYHAYNLIQQENDDQIGLRRLYEMLEGQVAVLASGYLSAGEAVELLDALKRSALFREDQYSYILYPDRRLPAFVEKNVFGADILERSQLLKKLITKGNSQIVLRNVNGEFHFNGSFRNAGMLKDALEALPQEYTEMAKKEVQTILDIFEELFDHQSFTGRSGTFYGYEGLGSIYWHMVSKLLLAVGDTYYRAYEAGVSDSVLGRLAEHYYEVRAGIGLNKGPDLFGAFPTDPYSHTPGGRGAQQPGMTGQVKEDIIARWEELGVVVRDGKLQFKPILLRKEEFLQGPSVFQYIDVNGTKQFIPLQVNSLAFTYCMVPIIYRRSEQSRIVINLEPGPPIEIEGDTIDEQHTASIFRREGKISSLEVWLQPRL